MSRLSAASAAATKKGRRWSIAEKAAPKAGPRMKPSPKAAPIRPMPRARSRRVVTSATYAWAAAYEAPATPWRMRATNSSSRVPATPISRADTALPASEARMTGRRP